MDAPQRASGERFIELIIAHRTLIKLALDGCTCNACGNQIAHDTAHMSIHPAIFEECAGSGIV
jgi:hypothetical protein